MPYGPIAYYQIRWRPDDSDGEWLQANFPTDASKFSIGPLQKGTNYVIQARSVGPTGLVSIWVDISHTVSGNSPMETPSSLTATGAADSVRLDWMIAASLGGGALFCVERGTSSTGPWTEITRCGSMYTIVTEKTDGTYYYRVRMTNYDGDFSGYSNVASSSPVTTAEILAELSDISSDNVLTPDEKPLVIRDRDWILAEQAGLDGQATLYSITTEKTAYDSAITTLTSYLATLTSPVLWSNLTDKTNIVGATFRQKFIDVFTAKTALTNAITAAAKALIATAQTAATNAQTDATSALNTLVDISSDSVLTPGEKPFAIRDRDAILAEQTGIDAKATAFAIGTEKASYDSAVTALTSYLATLTSPVLWSNLTDKTSIAGGTFRQKFLDVYNARQTLLNKIYQTAKDIADGKVNTYYQSTQPYSTGGIVGDLWTNPDTGLTMRWDGSTWTTSSAFTASANGSNLLVNASFQSNLMMATVGAIGLNNKQITDGWMVMRQEGANSGTSYVSWSPAIGIRCQVGGTSVTVPGNNIVAPQSRTLQAFSVEGGAVYVMNFTANYLYNGALNSGITAAARLTILWYDINGAQVGAGNTLSRARGAANGTGTGIEVTAPATAVSAHAFVDVLVSNANATPTAAGTSSIALQANFTAVLLYKKSLLGVPGSGVTIGDTRNLPPIVVGNGLAKIPTVITYTAFSGSPATATISVAAWTMLSGSVNVSYGAKSVGVTGTNSTTTNFFLYLDDPTYSGTGTLVATTNGNTVFGADGRIFIGTVSITFPASGSGSGGGSPGGGGNSCVCIDMNLLEGFMAAEAREGFVIDCLDLPVSDTVFKRGIKAVKFSEEECVRIITDGGAELDLSACTPFDLIDGRVAFAEDMLNEIVVTDHGLETVIEVLPIGVQPVARISVGGISYAAGRDPKHRIFSHNLIKP